MHGIRIHSNTGNCRFDLTDTRIQENAVQRMHKLVVTTSQRQ